MSEPVNALRSSASTCESLKNMNGTTAKFATWCVRILAPKVISYTFSARGETVDAKKFQCVIVSRDASQYMLGTVGFNFADRGAADKALAKYTHESVWIVRNPCFDTNIKVDFIGAPIKQVLLLNNPSTLTHVPPPSVELHNHPALYVDVAMDLKAILETLAKTAFRLAQGSGRPETKTVDVCGKLLQVTEPKNIQKAGKTYTVATAEMTDNSGGLVHVSVFDRAVKDIMDIPSGSGVTLCGLTSTRDGGELKLNMWESVHVIAGGPKAQSLTGMDHSLMQLQLLTSALSAQGTLNVDDKEAQPTCAAALAEAGSCGEDKVFQINRALFDPPLNDEAMFAQGVPKRMYVNCRLHDRTGVVDVEVLNTAAPALYGCKDENEVNEKLKKGTLQAAKERLNVKGVLRDDGKGGVKRTICQAAPSPLVTRVSRQAMKATLGLASVVGEIVIPAPFEFVLDSPMLGMAGQILPDSPPISAHRFLLLVQGTCPTKLDTLEAVGASLQDQTFKVSSSKVRCLLSTTEQYLDLVGYCDFANMLTYRLDCDIALVLVSAITVNAPDSVSADTPKHTATI